METTKQETNSAFTDPIFSQIQENISYWKAEIDTGYSCHLFVVKIFEKHLLEEIWSAVSARIATAYQARLETEIEKYNIYLLFLCSEKIINEVKYKIEQDKYCCRKLVIDNLGQAAFSDDRVKEIINERIFSLPTLKSIGPDIDKNINSTVAKILAATQPEIFKILTDYQASDKKFEPYYLSYKTTLGL